jgi:16S rRNA (uracil1498-N3)-methyltransferase
VRLTRVFTNEVLASGAQITLGECASKHLVRVLRVRSGAQIVLFDGRGGEYEGLIGELRREGVRVSVGAHRAVERESPLEITLVQGISRGERMDLVVQKATELGVARIVALQAERSVVRLDEHMRARRLAHWNAVAIGACEQCGRNRPPQLLGPATLGEALALSSPAALRLLLDPLAPTGIGSMLRPPPASVALLIGPEGGLTEAEIAAAALAGFRGCTLGPRVLRTETAALAALAAIAALAGDLGTDPPLR